MRLIDPKMSIDTIKSYIEVWDCHGCLPYGGTQHNVMAVDDLQYLPTIDAEPVRHGRWLTNPDNGERYCNQCGWVASWANERYCSYCGARMDGGADDA